MLTRWKQRSSEYQKGLSVFTFIVFGVTLLLLYAGGFTTTIGAGMVFPDWPLSNGSLNPPGWTTDQAMAAEHGHRLLGAATGLLSIALVLWTYLREGRAWVRWLSVGVLALVIFQGLLGGMRVLFDSLDLAKVHGVTAQIFLCALVSVAVGCSRWWRRLPLGPGEGTDAPAWQRQRALGVALTVLIIAQLVIGSVMRHRGAGLAIPYFPFSTEAGDLLPAAWNWAVTIHFAHRAMALVITAALLWWAWKGWRAAQATPAMKRLTALAVLLLVVQILLGAEIIWSLRAPIQTTLHVLNGALLLSAVWAVTFASFRPALEGGRKTVPMAAPSSLRTPFAPQRS
jgi:heme a synthase